MSKVNIETNKTLAYRAHVMKWSVLFVMGIGFSPWVNAYAENPLPEPILYFREVIEHVVNPCYKQVVKENASRLPFSQEIMVLMLKDVKAPVIFSHILKTYPFVSIQPANKKKLLFEYEKSNCMKELRISLPRYLPNINR